MYSLVRDLDFSNNSTFRPKRVGIVPVVDLFGVKYYCFGVDRIHQEITDFGGGVRYRRDYSALAAATREFHEESLGVFGKLLTYQLQNDIAIYDDDNLIVIHCNDEIDIPQKVSLFNENCKQEVRPEVSAIIWFSVEEVRHLVYKDTPLKPIMYTYGAEHYDTKKFVMYDKVKWLLRRSKYFE